MGPGRPGKSGGSGKNGGQFMGRHEKMMEAMKEPKPESIKEVPGYLYRLITKFFHRLFYIFRLVWDTKPWILLYMIFMAIFNGVTPVIGAKIGADLLNALASAYVSATQGHFEFDLVMKILIIRFAYNFTTGLINRISNILNNISSELVVNHVNLKIMYKSREVDLASFDLPEFYEKFENAKREAGNRPIHILNANFTIISTVISMFSFVVALLSVSPWAPLVILAMSVPTALINFRYRKKNFWYLRWHSKERRQMNYYSNLMTNKDMVKEIRLFHLSDLFIGRYQETFLVYFRGLKKLFVEEGLLHMCMTVVTTTINCLLFLYIAKGVAEGKYEVGDYSFYTGALSSISSGIGTLISTTASIYEGTLFIDNLISFMDEKPTIVPLLPVAQESTYLRINLLINELVVVDNWNGLFILPILSAVSQFVMTKLTEAKNPQPAPAANGQQQPNSNGFMKWFFPLFSLWICSSYNALFSLYWVISNVFAWIQSVVLNKVFDNMEKKDKSNKEENLK